MLPHSHGLGRYVDDKEQLSTTENMSTINFETASLFGRVCTGKVGGDFSAYY